MVGSDGEAYTTSVAAILPFVLCGERLKMKKFDGGNYQRLVGKAPAFAARLHTHIGLVHLEVRISLAADPILVG